MSSTAIREL